MRNIIKSVKVVFYYLSWFLFISLVCLVVQFVFVGENEFLHPATIELLAIYFGGSAAIAFVFRLIYDESGYRTKKTVISAFEDSERFMNKKARARR